MDKKLLNDFSDPGSEFRGAPFWAWNGKLEPEELRRQIRIMNRMGLGGFFMHSRVGLDTAYLSEDWFECVEACIDEAKKLKMRAWLYDEDRWPSGAAGGLVTKNPKYRARSLVMEETTDTRLLKWTADVLAAFTAKVDGSAASDVKRVKTGSRPRKLEQGESLLIFRVEVQAPSSWYNDQAYLDTLSHEAVAEFVRVTHEAYEERIKADLGKVVPGIFTDEPNFSGICGDRGAGRTATAWTGKLPQVFRKRYGYDLIRRLPEVFLNVEGVPMSQARYHYMDCVAHLFADAFCRLTYEWCEKNGVDSTGHMLAEDRLSDQTSVAGSCMRCYEYMQAPGMDLLTEHWRIYDTAKQVSSAANQFGRKWRLSETYGCTGWDFPFVGHKALGDWQAALGINLRCQHLSWYTMLGQAKRDYPANIFYQSPWWELYSKVEDYFGRVLAVMTRGTEVRDLLVIHPIESMWTMIGKGWRGDPAVHEYDNMLIELRDSLLTENIDFDYGDEELLSRHARAGKVKGEPVFRVGKARYKAVLVPPLRTMRSTTLALLKKFQAAGGLVVFAGDPAQYVDALPSDAVAEFAATCPKTKDRGQSVARAVEGKARRMSITDGTGKAIPSALYLLREDKDNLYLFVCNTGHSKSQLRSSKDDAMVRDRREGFEIVCIEGLSECAGSPLELDADTGAIYAADAKLKRDTWQIRTSLPPAGSRLFVIPRKARGRKYAPRPKLKDVRSTTLGGDRWGVSLSESNVLVLDWPKYKIGAGRMQRGAEVLQVDGMVRDALGIRRRGGQMVQPWARERSEKPERTEVTLSYSFEANAIPSGPMFIALERPETFQIAINGVALDMDSECGWWCDLELRKIPFDPASLRLGQNEIVLTCDYTEDHPGLEITYLLGNFGTKVKGRSATMTQAPASLKIGDWVKQGLAFYSGSVSYCGTVRPKLRKGERLFVQVPEYRGAAVRVIADGQSAGVIAWEPNEVDITDLVGEGPVDLRIEVIGHRRNSHGPLHHKEKWPNWTGPAEFTPPPGQWTDDYNLVPCGLMQKPRLIVRR